MVIHLGFYQTLFCNKKVNALKACEKFPLKFKIRKVVIIKISEKNNAHTI